MTRFYFIRHGETQWNVEKRYQGHTDIPLSETGLKQGELLGKRFKNIPVDYVYASPLIRAVETAKFVAEATNNELNTIDSFKEINFGEWEGHTVNELKQKYKDSYINFLKEPFKYGFPGEGSFDNVAKRVMEGIDQLLKAHEGKNIVVVSHGGILKIAIMYLMEMDGSFYRKLWLDNTSITTIDFRNNEKFLITYNDKAHLENTDF